MTVLLAATLFEVIEGFLNDLRRIAMVAVLAIGAGFAIHAWWSRKSAVAALGAGFAMILVVAVIAASPALSDATVSEVEKHTGGTSGSSGEISKMFSPSQ